MLGTLRLIDLIANPSQPLFREVQSMLLRRAYMGDDNARRALYSLSYFYTIASNINYFKALYGEARVYGELLKIAGSIPVHSRLEVLAEEYRYDRTVADDLFSELLAFKKRLVSEGAPVPLVHMLDQILAGFGAKPEEVYRNIRHLISLYELWKEHGEDVEKYIQSMPGAPKGEEVTDTELSKLILFVVTQLRAGNRVTTSDLRRYVGNQQLVNKMLAVAKKRGLLVYSTDHRSWMPTTKGLEFVGVTGVTPEDLAP